MATSADFVCGICESQNISKPAQCWCKECDKCLCSICEKHHTCFKAPKEDYVVAKEKYGDSSSAAESSLASLALTTEKGDQDQIVASPKSIDDITPTLIDIYATIDFPRGSSQSVYCRGCSFLPNLKFVIADDENKQLLIQDERKTTKQIQIPCKSINVLQNTLTDLHDVCLINDKTIGVSGTSGIYIINLETKRMKKEIKTDGACYGIIYDKGTLVCCVQSKGVQRIRLKTADITTIVKQNNLPSCSDVTIHDDNIYLTNPESNTVTCYNSRGEELWVFKDTSVIESPSGITVDDRGNLYVASWYNSELVALSADGKKGRRLPSCLLPGGLWRPNAIDFDLKNKKLLVVNANEPAFLYSVAYDINFIK